MKKKIATIIILILILVSILGVVILKNGEIYNIQKDGLSDVEFKTNSYEALAHIETVTTYRLEGKNYKTVYFHLDSPSFYSSPNFDISEEDFDRYFGNGNDSFKTMVYELYAKAPILIYKKFLFPPIEEYPAASLSGTGPNEYPYSSNLDKGEWSKNSAVVYVNREESVASCIIREYRFSVFGETDFSDDDKDEVKQEISSIGNKFVQDYIE